MKKNCNFFIFSFLICFCINIFGQENEKFFVIEKRKVLYKFVSHNSWIDTWVQHEFYKWEEDTFDVFEKVKDKDTIAIDIGAWIGATTIWLAKNFAYVVAIEPDLDAIRCLKKNLKASECYNVKICEKPIFNTNEKVIFGSRSNHLNESVSHIKQQANDPEDYTIEAITFDNFINDYISSDENIEKEISFIKCDIEGGEEAVLEDLMNFAFYNNCKVYMSFHLSWWKSKKITDFENLFQNFNVSPFVENISEYIAKNPFCSLLFEPKNNRYY